MEKRLEKNVKIIERNNYWISKKVSIYTNCLCYKLQLNFIAKFNINPIETKI